jgi:uncharacterized protein (DUF1810 family)
MKDPFDLERFVTAQQQDFENIQAELRQGCKRGHWMWFIFPQLKGLGRSAMAQYYGLSSRTETEAYLQHPLLGPRLVDCTELVHRVEGRSIQEIFGEVDAMKFRSSMTLFAEVNHGPSVFVEALKKYYDGHRDQLTLSLLSQKIV